MSAIRLMLVLVTMGAALPVLVSCRDRSRVTGESDARLPDKGTEPWREVPLGPLPAEADLCGPAVSEPHGWRYGRVVRTVGGCRLWLDGTTGPTFDNLLVRLIPDVGAECDYAFSSDGGRLAYVATEKGRMRMVVEGKPGPAAERAAGPLFSPDGRRLAYEVLRNEKRYVLVDGVPGPACDRVMWGAMQFSPDSRRFAYPGTYGRKLIMVVDQREQREWPGGGIPVFSPDSRHVAYTTFDGLVLDGHLTAWGTGKTGHIAQPVFSPDSQHVAASGGTARSGRSRGTAILDSIPLPLPNGGEDCCQVVFSPDLQSFACVMRRGRKDWVIMDGTAGPEFDRVWNPIVSDDGRVAYQAQTDGRWFMVVGSERGAECALGHCMPTFSPDGRRIAYIAGVGPQWSVVVDGQSGPEYEGSSGRHGLALEEYQVPGVSRPAFSPDSQHVAYGARADGLWFVLLDGAPVGPKYDLITPGGPSFRANGTLEFLGIRDRTLYRVTIRPAAGSAQPAGGP